MASWNGTLTVGTFTSTVGSDTATYWGFISGVIGSVSTDAGAPSINTFVDAITSNDETLGPDVALITVAGEFIGYLTVGANNYTFVYSPDDDTSTASSTPTLFGITQTVGATVAFTLTEGSPALPDYTITAESGSFTLTGQDVNFKRMYNLQAETGSFALTGINANFVRSLILVADTGSFTLTGQDAVFRKVIVFAADTGSFALTGQPANFKHSYILIADTGSYTFTGKDATITYIPLQNYVFPTNTGYYTLTGQAATIKRTYKIIAETGSFTLTGLAAHFLRSDSRIQRLADSTALKGQAIKLLKPTTANTAASLVWSSIPDVNNFDMLVRLRPQAIVPRSFNLFIRAELADLTLEPDLYQIQLVDTAAVRLIKGFETPIQYTWGVWTGGNWHWLRIRARFGRIFVRIWNANVSEPTVWHINALDTDYPPTRKGLVGFRTRNHPSAPIESYDLDYVALGNDLRTAPLPVL